MSNWPKTAEEWWSLMDEWKADLRKIVQDFHPFYRQSDVTTNMRIGVVMSEVMDRETKKRVKRMTNEDPVVRFDRYVDERDIRLPELLSEAWFGVPESESAHGINGYGVLCDLCVMSYLVHEGEKSENQ